MKTRATTRAVQRRRQQSHRTSPAKGRKKATGRSPIHPVAGARSLALVMLRTGVHRRTSGATRRLPPKLAAARRKFEALSSKAPQDVPRQDWKEYLDGFNVEHEGRPTRIQAFQPDETSSLEAHDLPLEGISIDKSQSETFASVIAGEEAADHITHMIPRTVRITALSESELEIEAADRSVTIVSCS